MNKVTFVEDGHKYFDALGREVPSVSEILKHFGISKFDEIREIIGSEAIEASAEFGTHVHKACALYDNNDLLECDPLIVPYLNGWKKYTEQYKPHFIAIELPMISRIWGFAGTPDRIEESKGYAVVSDIKTGVKTSAEEIQTAFYQILVEENLNIPVRSRHAVHLGNNTYNIVPHINKGAINLAKSLISIYNFKKAEGLL